MLLNVRTVTVARCQNVSYNYECTKYWHTSIGIGPVPPKDGIRIGNHIYY